MSLISNVGDYLNLGIIRFVPTPVPALPTGTDGHVQTIVNWVSGGAAVLCLIGLLIAGGQMAVAKKRGDDMEMGTLGKVALGGIVIAGAAQILTAIGL